MPAASEKRKHMRLPLDLDGEILLDQAPALPIKIRNISFGGLYAEMDTQAEQFAIGKEYSLVILLTWEKEQIRLKFSASIRHLQKDGVGFEFSSIEVASWEHFKNLMVLNSPDPEKLLEELQENPGISNPKRSSS